VLDRWRPRSRLGLTPIGTNASPTGQASAPQRLEIVPVVTNPDADFEGIVGKIAAEARRSCVAARTAESLARSLHIAWLSNTDCALGEPVTDMSQLASIVADLRNNAGLGVRVFLHVADNDLVRHLPAGCTGPVIDADLIDQDEREAILIASLGAHATDLGAEVAQVARDFRLQHRRLRRVAASVTARPGGPRQGDLTAACQAEIHVDLHGLAERVTPRFRPDDIVLPPAIAAQLAEVRLAIRNSGRVYYEWGAAEAMAEGGIALLFSGAPGTGKTMAAEVLAAELDLPLYRIDLSQVVNKYIGETEKNLKRVFDATEASRAILFFDEADALFGKRTEVKDANDRFANVETGYLLQRMERYRGVAILATNRRRDLDEAFSRRLRYAIEFPVPSVAERDSIWRRVFPPRVDLSLLDIPFLARQFQLSGGHIRSIAFNACLQAAETAEPRVTMREVLIATRRELDKLGWTSRAELFGRYATEIEELHA
jgi:adenylate kinase family enzyme